MPDSMLFLDATMLSRIQFGFTITHTWANYRVFHVKSEDDAGYGH